jgi:MFS family permease
MMTTTARHRAIASLQKMLINPNYARLWCGQSFSTLADYTFDTTLVLWVATFLAKDKPWAPEAVSGLLLSAGLAVIVVGPLLGVFVDRLDRRLVMLRTDLFRFGAVGAFFVLSCLPSGVLPAWAWLTVIYAVVFLLNSGGQLFSSARFAIIGDIVTDDAARAHASGMSQAAVSVAAIIGPPIAGPLLFGIGLRGAVLLDALSYAVSYLTIRSLKLSHVRLSQAELGGTERSGYWKTFVSGLRYVLTNRFVMVILSLSVICQLGGGAMNTLDVFFVTRNLHASPRVYGVMGAAFGVGGILGALCAGWVVRRITARVTTWLCLLVAGAAIMAYSRMTELVGGLLLFFLAAIPITMLSAAVAPLLLKSTDRGHLGRMFAVFNPVNQAASMISVVIAGWLVSSVLRNFSLTAGPLSLHPVDVVFLGAGFLIMISGAFAIFSLPGNMGGETVAKTDVVVATKN